MSLQEGISKSIAGWQMAGSYALSNVQAKAGKATDIAARELAETVIGLRYGATLALGKAQTLSGDISERMVKTRKGVEKSVVGVATKVGESFGNITKAATSWKYPLYIAVGILAFMAIMVSIGYSGLGAPAARVAEKEYGRRR